MKNKGYLNCMVCLLITGFSFGAELTISVLLPDKTPAVGVKVQHVQSERYGIHNKLQGVTDENGQVKIQFQEKRNTESRFGYGVHRFVIMPDKYRWEVSDLFYWNLDSKDQEELRLKGIPAFDSYKKRTSRSGSNWSVGKLVKVGNVDSLEWKVTLKKGRDVKVKVIDQFKEPVRNRKFEVSLNIEVDSHTGWGGEIDIFKTQTDEKGCFSLSKVGDFYYSFDLVGRSPKAKDQNTYIAPDVSGWTGAVNSILKKKKQEVVYHRCIPKKAVFVVKDKKTGEVVPKATIFRVLSYPCTTMGGPFGSTDVNGEYISRKFYTEHLSQFGVEKEGYKRYVLDAEEFADGKIFSIALEPQTNEACSSNDNELKSAGKLKNVKKDR